MIENLLHLLVQLLGRLVQVNGNGHIRLTGSVLAHVLRFFVEASIDRVALTPSNETAGSGGFGIHQPLANPRDIFVREVSGPSVLVTLPASIHFQRAADQLTNCRAATTNLFEQSARSCVR